MSEPLGDHPLRTEAFVYAERLLFKDIVDGGKWSAEQEGKVLLPMARQLVEQGGDATREGMQLARFFELDKHRANVFTHVIRTSEDPDLRREAIGHLLKVEGENDRSDGLMVAAGSPDTYVAHAALVAVDDIKRDVNQSMVVGAGIRNENEGVANLALNIARTFDSEQRIGRILREGLRSKHSAIRERCLSRAQKSGDSNVRNRVLRDATALGLME
ncbi:MAG TPA: hypothetical protein VIF43_02080 [Patescibacteria group bacterium]|jgi:hypothetical protein